MNKEPVKQTEIPTVFSQDNYHQICDQLACVDQDFKTLLTVHGYPPMWTRPNSFETLVHIILEQQVSLASALSALKKLQEKTRVITPKAILALTDDELRACYVSRQKTVYIRGLATALETSQIVLEELEELSNDQVRSKLIPLKGIGNWTIDIFLMFVLHRIDIFPIGDLAAVSAIKRLKKLPLSTPVEEIFTLTLQWQPYRTVACMMLWHYYLSGTSTKMPLI